jgi:hypothetical protein
MVIYDFSTVEDRISTSGSRTVVYLKISPGIKVVPDRTVLNVWKTVMDNWGQVKSMEENRAWVSSLRSAAASVNYTGRTHTQAFYVTIGLYDEYGDIIQTATETYRYGYIYSSSFQIIAQHKYFDDNRFKEISFSSVPAEKITNTITPRIIEVGVRSNDNPRDFSWRIQTPIMTVPEWQERLSLQGAAR